MKKIALKFLFSGGVNLENKRINKVSICTAGEAKGHGIWIDSEFLSQMCEFTKNNDVSISSYSMHPQGWNEERIYEKLGYLENFTTDGNQCFADFQFIETDETKSKINHLLTWAEKRPKDIAVSIEFCNKIDAKGNAVFRIVDGNYYSELAELTGVAFTEDPAANPGGLFTSGQELVKNFKLSILKMKKVKFKKFKLGTATFEEFGDVYYDGELVMGTIIYIDDAKTTMIPEGQYTLEGKVYTIGTGGVISDVADVIAEYAVSKEEMEALLAANAELAAKKLAAEQSFLARESELKVKSDELALLAANLTAANAKILSLKSQNQNGMKNKNNFSCTKEGYLNFLQAKKEGRVRSQIASLQGVYRAFDRQSEAAGKPTNFIKSIQNGQPISYNFASGVNFIGDVTSRANAISSLIRTELLESNEIFSNLANYGDGLGDIPFRAANEKNAKAFDVTLPTLSNSTIAYGVGQNCDKVYSGKVDIASRTMKVGLWEANQAFCPDEWPNLFQSIWYVDDIQMPLEYILVDFIMDILVSDLASKLVFGVIDLTPNNGQPVDGLYQQTIADADIAIANHKIPQVAWTNINVQTQLRELVNASSTPWKTACKSKSSKKKRTPLMLIAPSIVDLYLEFIQNSNNNANADIIANGMDYSQYFASTACGKVKFVLCEALELDDAGANKGKVILCDRENVIYGETKDTLTMYPWIYYDFPTGRILFRNRDFAGIGYAQSEYIVVNTIA